MDDLMPIGVFSDQAAARAADAAVFERAKAGDGLGGMGTTLCAVGLTDDGNLVVINVGDSRAYLLRNGSLRRLTTDHTVVAELVRQGELAENEIADHPQRGVLTRAVGVGRPSRWTARSTPRIPAIAFSCAATACAATACPTRSAKS